MLVISCVDNLEIWKFANFQAFLAILGHLEGQTREFVNSNTYEFAHLRIEASGNVVL